VLVLAPLLGRMHQVVHAPGLGGVAAIAQEAGHAHAPFVPVQAGHAHHALFAGHTGSDCQLLDQQLLGSALLLSLAVQIHAPPAAPPAHSIAAHHAVRRLPAFRARAPPLQA